MLRSLTLGILAYKLLVPNLWYHLLVGAVGYNLIYRWDSTGPVFRYLFSLFLFSIFFFICVFLFLLYFMQHLLQGLTWIMFLYLFSDKLNTCENVLELQFSVETKFKVSLYHLTNNEARITGTV